MISEEEVFSFLDEEYGWLCREPYLSRISEKELLIAANHGSEEARHQILTSWFHLSLYEAANHCQTLEFYPDLVQWGEIGAMQALERFEVARGNRFSTYAVWWIKRYITYNMPNVADIIRLPNYIWADKELHQENVIQTVHVDEVELAVTTQPMDDLLFAYKDSLNYLDEREKFIVEFRQHGDTLKEIGRALCITRERVRQLELGAIEKLRERLGDYENLIPSGLITSITNKNSIKNNLQITDHVYKHRAKLPTIYRYVKKWVIQNGHERPQLTDRKATFTASREAFKKFFQSYEDCATTTIFSETANIKGEKLLISEKMIEAIGLERIWFIKWDGQRCSIKISCGGYYSLNVDVDKYYYSLSVKLRVSIINTGIAKKVTQILPGCRFAIETVGKNKNCYINTKVSQHVRANDLGYIIRSLIRCVTVNEIRVAAVQSSHVARTLF